ncbi:hypothetical protein BJ508DRAFT_318096 [Ascobolus immersus RN42]|uniref:Uncharacterized protein n=1 Tax=Ascobolus immersus RN42 TaxID=1160509 RepID=A0A3N4I8A9_ASCIM|nr:hypothetical protein BJ508DRAFT_318096 [Ascobolus immersus RN42]
MSAHPQQAPLPADLHPDGTLKGEAYETRQTGERKEDWIPNPANSLKLSEPKRKLLEDVLALYCGQPSVERVRRYAPDAVYDDPLSYANDRYQIAGQWFALPKMARCENKGYEVVRDEPETWSFPPLPASVTLNSLVTLTLDPETAQSDWPTIKYHKDQASEKDYTHTGLGQKIKEWQAKGTAAILPDERLKEFEADRTDEMRGGKREYAQD